MSLTDLSQFKGTVAIIAAAGVGSRMQADSPKQYLKIDRQTILDITIERFLKYPKVGLIILVISPQDIYFKHLAEIQNEKIIIIEGGVERVNSVNNALCFLADWGLPDKTGIMVHDAARPCITHQDLDLLEAHFSLNKQACLLVSPVVDTLQKIDEQAIVLEQVDRSHLVRALTPQMAKFTDLKIALNRAIEQKQAVTDEASALSFCGIKVKALIGRNDNIKITYPADLALVSFYLQQQTLDESLA